MTVVTELKLLCDCRVTQSIGDKSQDVALAAAQHLKPGPPHASESREHST
jgi:hypothetical protein